MPADPPGPDSPELVAYVDGGSRGNPGPAGWGAFIRSDSGGPAVELNGFLGVTTNNVAEYQGLIGALRHAHSVGARRLVVHADSELMVKQMNGQYKVKSPHLQVLHREARLLARGLPEFRISHVRREQNRDADRLANDAMDAGA
jgi:ribonuclease HI